VHETTTFLLVTLPNNHRFKKNSLTDSAVNYLLIRLLATPPYLKYTTLQFIVNPLFSDINISQGSVQATYGRYGGIFNNQFTANLARNLPVKKVRKSVKIWQNNRDEFVASLISPVL